MLPPRQFLEEMFSDCPRTRESSIQCISRRADQKPFRNHTRIISCRKSFGRFFGHRLFFSSEHRYLRKALVAQCRVWLEADCVDDYWNRLVRGIEQSARNASRTRIGITTHPRPLCEFRFIDESHATQELKAEERAQVRRRMWSGAAVT